MTNQAIARDLLAGLCLLQGLATAAIDLGRTHATNPEWPGHARFHAVWQTAAFVWLAVIEAGLLLFPGAYAEERFYLAALLAAAPMAGFFTALAVRGLFKGTLSDPNGMPPLRIRIAGRVRSIDLNLVAEIAGVLTLVAIVALYRHGA